MAIIGNEYERSMAKAFKLDNYMATDPEKLALKDLATDFIFATDISFGALEDSQKHFEQVFTEVLGLEKNEELAHMSYEALWKIKMEAIKTFSSARLMYEANKIDFDQAYELVLKYALAKYPEMDQRLSR